MISGRRDEVVPPKHMNKLHQLALLRGRPTKKSKQNEPIEDPSQYTVFSAFPGGTHGIVFWILFGSILILMNVQYLRVKDQDTQPP